MSDLRAVAQALTPAARRRLSRPLRFERVYYDATSWFGALDPTKTKSWQGMFPGLSRKEAEVAARDKGYEPSWLRDGSLKLSHVVGSPFRSHPSDGAEAYDLREAVTTLEDAGRIARRVLGSSHPLTGGLGRELLLARAKLSCRETPSPGSA